METTKETKNRREMERCYILKEEPGYSVNFTDKSGFVFIRSERYRTKEEAEKRKTEFYSTLFVL